MSEQRESEGKLSLPKDNLGAFKLSRDPMTKLAGDDLPENARDTVPIEKPPASGIIRELPEDFKLPVEDKPES